MQTQVGIDAQVVLAQLSLREKASLLDGSDFWHTEPVERLGVPRILVTDGPHGLRKVAASDDASIEHSDEATCFPPAAGFGSSWDPELAQRVGQALGRECRVAGVAVLLGPGVNIKRSPLCGRNFEYYSEDPLLAGKLADGLGDRRAEPRGRDVAQALRRQQPGGRTPARIGRGRRAHAARDLSGGVRTGCEADAALDDHGVVQQDQRHLRV